MPSQRELRGCRALEHCGPNGIRQRPERRGGRRVLIIGHRRQLSRWTGSVSSSTATSVHGTRSVAVGADPTNRLTTGTNPRMPPNSPLAVTRMLYFTVAEGLTNAARYAGAQRVEIEAARLAGRLRVEVRDDGRGGADPAVGSGLTAT